MSTPQMHRVRAASARVALITTAIVAAVYLVIAVVVVFIVTRNLTSDVDARLVTALTRITTEPRRITGTTFSPPPGGPRFGPPLLIWTVSADGVVTTNDTTASLPSQFQSVKGPESISIGGTDVRVAGSSVGGVNVIVGQTLDSVLSARSTVILAEVIVGPILLAAVFLGALTIGRRVAAPIELARQRQMDFTADASHELRTPLSVIEASTSLALAHDRDPAWYRKAFVRVDAESKRMRHLVEDLLWLARFDATRGHPGAEPVDVAVLARQAADRFATLAESRNVSLTVRDPGVPLIVSAPPEWLDRLLGVLLDNACKYAPACGTVDVVLGAESGRVRLAVEDSGPGIPEQERARIFDRFHRATERAGGAGLGLAIADSIVRASGGRWDVGTSASGGASMSVSWHRVLSGRDAP